MTSIAASRRLSRFVPPPVLLALAYGALSLAWVVGNPVGLAPDEPSHYLKALAVGAGRPAGEGASPPPPNAPKKEAWVRRTARAVEVPAGLSPIGLDCNKGDRQQSAACQYQVRPPPVPTKSLTQIGSHQPTAYVLPGLLARLADNPVTAIQLGRLASAAVSLSLVAMAMALLWDRSIGTVSMVGLVMALTPMVVFMASSLTSSGPEITAGICFFSALLRLARGPTPRAWPWVALGISGVVLAASRTLGPLWVVLDVVVFVLAQGLRRSWSVARSAGRPALLSLSAVMVAMVLCVGWEVVVQPRGPFDLTALRGAVRPSVEELHRVLGELVGVFGVLDSLMPPFAYVLWWTMLAIIFVLALWVGGGRERVVLVIVVAGVVPLSLLIAVVNLAQTGFGMQGRYVLPVGVVGPLLAGEVLARARARAAPVARQWSSVTFVLLAAGIQAVAWYANSRRSALGTDGSWVFMGSSEWSPRTGWYPLLAVVAVAVLLVVWFVVASFRPAGQAAPQAGRKALPRQLREGHRARRHQRKARMLQAANRRALLL